MLYACDGHWWKRHFGVPAFNGIKICQDGNEGVRWRGLCKVDVPEGKSTKILIDKPGVLGGGGPNSGFQAINLAIQFGAKRILLVGFDMHAAAGLHWHGPHGGGLNNPSDGTFVKWRGILDGAAGFIRSMDIDVVNASPGSALNAYPKMTVAQAMKRWGV